MCQKYEVKEESEIRKKKWGMIKRGGQLKLRSQMYSYFLFSYTLFIISHYYDDLISFYCSG